MRVGMIGAGGIARVHVGHLLSIDGVDVIGVADIAADRAEALAAECGATAVTDYRALLDDVDAVYVCSPPTLHREQVTAAVEAGKDVFCEKPLATTMEDGRAIVDALASSNVQLMVGFNNRFRPAFRRLRDLYRDGDLGALVSAWMLRVAPSTPRLGANWRTTPGLACGVTIESASHDIDFVRWALGEVAAVSAGTSSSLPELPGYDNTLNALLELEDGTAVTLTISWASAISQSSRGIVGTNGAACLLGPDMWTLSELRWGMTGEMETVEALDQTEGADLGYRAASEHFIECLREDRAPEATAEDGLAALDVSIALKTAAAEGRTVQLASRPTADASRPDA